MKLVGIAGAVGVAATGALVARNERQRRAYTPDEVREQLHVRYAQATAAEPPIDTAAENASDTTAEPPIDTAAENASDTTAQNASESDEKDAAHGWGRLRERVRRLTRRNR